MVVTCFAFSAIGLCRDEYYALGLHQIAKAVSFLNNDCKLVSIYDFLFFGSFF